MGGHGRGFDPVWTLERKRDLVAYDPANGAELWRLDVPPPGLSGYHNFPAVLADGTLVLIRDRWLWGISPGGVVYAMGSTHPDGSGYLKSYAPDGTLRWELELPDHEANDFVDTGSPVVGDDGTVYLRTSEGRVMAVADTVGPAIHAQWPELRGGPSRLGRRQPR